jgi:hypothetical protein
MNDAGAPAFVSAACIVSKDSLDIFFTVYY